LLPASHTLQIQGISLIGEFVEFRGVGNSPTIQICHPDRILNELRFEKYQGTDAPGTLLPPVKLYQSKNVYFVLDGNHRVAPLK